MPPIGSVIKNSLVMLIITAITSFVAVFYFLWSGLAVLIRSASDVQQYSSSEINTAAIQLTVGFLILLGGFGLGLSLSLPNIVGDEMIEF